jgi:protein TonB
VQTFETIVEVPGPSFLQKLGRGRRASIVSLMMAVSVHAALIGTAVWYVGSVERFVPARLVLPKGVAAEVDGSDGGVAVQFMQNPPPLEAMPVTHSPMDMKQLLAPPPAEFEPPQAPKAVVKAEQGTADFGPLPEFSTGSIAPPRSARRVPPGLDREAPSSTQTPAPASSPLADVASAGGTATSGTHKGNGGGPQGVVDGLPVPSARNRHPEYPDDARRRGWTGTVQLELDLDEAGHVTAARVLRSCGHEVLDKAALQAARTWAFSPATLGGRPVPVTVPVPVNYALESR